MAQSTREAPARLAINNVMRSVHTGDVLGKPTEVVWLLAALVLASQAISGALMWWNMLFPALDALQSDPRYQRMLDANRSPGAREPSR